MSKQESIYCDQCKRNTLHIKPEASGCGLAVVIVLCILLAIYGGIVGIVIAASLFVLAICWGIITMLSEAFANWRCQTCGKTNPNRYMSNSPRG
jgi:hypothetical protein